LDKKAVNQILLIAEILAALFVSYLLVTLAKGWATGEVTNKLFLSKDLALTLDAMYVSPYEKTHYVYRHPTFGFAAEIKRNEVIVFNQSQGKEFSGVSHPVISSKGYEYETQLLTPQEYVVTGELLNIKPTFIQLGPEIFVSQEFDISIQMAKLHCPKADTSFDTWKEDLTFYFNYSVQNDDHYTEFVVDSIDSCRLIQNFIRTTDDSSQAQILIDISLLDGVNQEGEIQNDFIISYPKSSSIWSLRSEKLACLIYNKAVDNLVESYSSIQMNGEYESPDAIKISLVVGDLNADKPSFSKVGDLICESLVEYYD